MRDEFNLADLVEITGAKRRTVQLWAEAGALIADRGTEKAGTGVYRKFNRKEAIVASILTALSRLKISIGVMVEIAATTRWVMDQGDAVDEFEGCISGEKTLYLFYGAAKREEEFTMHYLAINADDDVDEELGKSVRKQGGNTVAAS
jgi:hypothetical protein